MKGAIFLIIASFSQLALPCGSTAHHFYTYWSLDSNEKKISRLKQMGCRDPINYSPRTADPIILDVLVDAIKREFPSEPIEKILKTYNCAYGSRANSECAFFLT